MTAALLLLNRGDGKNYFGLPIPRRNPRRTRNWVVLEGLKVKSEHNYKPQIKPGQRLMREYK